METDIKKLNRFTTIPFLIDLLKRKQLTLLNPRFWDDYNDRETLEVYRRTIRAESIYALCLTHQGETVHHWNAFAAGTSGCCIEFSPNRLIPILDKTAGVTHKKTAYIRITSLSKLNNAAEDLPFLKRHPFVPENEYRIIAVSDKKQEATFDIPITLDTIRRITISNKLPEATYESLKEILLQIDPAFRGKIYHSTLYSNSTWINHFTNKHDE